MTSPLATRVAEAKARYLARQQHSLKPATPKARLAALYKARTAYRAKIAALLAQANNT